MVTSFKYTEKEAESDKGLSFPKVSASSGFKYFSL
jgi:hypothetical protein